MKKSLVFGVLLVACVTPAALGRGILVSPSQLGLVGEPGSVVSDVIHISSSRVEKNYIQVNVGDFTRNEAGELQEIPAAEAVRSAKDWLEVDQSFLTSPETGRVELRVTAKIPPDASGSYWALVFLRSLPPPRSREFGTSMGTGLVIIPRIAIPVFVTVAGTEKRDVRAVETKVTAINAEGLECYTLVKNHGNVAVLLNGAFTLDSVTESTGEILELSETSFGALTLLPGLKMRIKGRIPWKGAVAGLKVNALVRYGPDPHEIVEAGATADQALASALVPGTTEPAATPAPVDHAPLRDPAQSGSERIAPPAPTPPN